MIPRSPDPGTQPARPRHRPQDARRPLRPHDPPGLEPGTGLGSGRGDAGYDAGTGAPREALVQASRRGLRLIGAAALIGCLQVLFMIGVELDRTLRHSAAIGALEAELENLEGEAEALRAVEEHAGDDVYREKLARAQGFMYPGETRLVVLPPPVPLGEP